MISQLIKLDPRVLRLCLVALPAMLLLLGWSHVLRPAWQARQAVTAQNAATRQALTELPARRAKAEALAQEAATLDQLLDAPETAPTRLATTLEGLARAAGIELQPVFPGQQSEFEGMHETRYELEASGPYPQLAAWLAAIETRLANVAIQEARFTRQPASDAINLRLRLAVYRRPATAALRPDQP